MSDALSFAELEVQQVELLPARTVLSTWGYGGDFGDDGGLGGGGGDNNKGGDGGEGGDGGHANAAVKDNVNNGFMQINIAIAMGGDGGAAHGGGIDANGGGEGGTDEK